MILFWLTIRSWIARIWKSIASCWARGPQKTSKKSSSSDPYNQKLEMRLRVCLPGEGGSRYEEDTTKWGSVSRHGLLQAGISCPYCGHEAARKGDFRLIHKTRFGEGLNCRSCLAVLLASPDDDIDPVKPGQPYDPSTYHVFARDAKHRRRIGQRITSAEPQKGDWVVIITEQPVSTTENQDVKTSYFGTEGRVDRVEIDGWYTVALGGNHGIAGAGLAPGSGMGGSWAMFRRDQIAVMVLPSLRARDTIRITQGPKLGLTGIVQSINNGIVVVSDVHDCTAPIELPMERVEKVVDNELFI